MKRDRGIVRLGAIVALGTIVAVLTVGFSLYGYAVNIRNQALAWETDLNATYRVNETELTAYTNTVVEQIGLAGAKSGKVNELVRAALEGRYGDKGFQSGTFANAIVEAYPDTKALDIYDKILPTIAAGREGIRNKQNLLVEKAQKYDNWRKQGIFRAWVLSGVYPSNDLSVKVGERTVTGLEALNQLKEPLINAATDTAFQTHRTEPLIK